MSCYLVTYDLIKKGQDYPKLHEILNNYDHIMLSESSYMVASDKSQTQVFDSFKKSVDGNDLLAVIKVTNNMTIQALSGTHEWLKDNLPKG
ncbi:MAG: hypothetical protein BA863_05130 [Desulfovibrio sp. S3730MH75]|nr:MAG: hypothetical protein BA863_05130 [Desulfovibrio sp. S3730MH75]